MWDDDPGWPSLTSLMWLFVPLIGIRRAAKTMGRGGGLLTLRLTFISFVSSAFLFQVVLVFAPSRSRELTGGLTWPIVVLIATSGFAALLWTRFEKPLDCTSDLTLISSYRTRYFARVAFAQSPSLVAFVGSFTTDAWWIYPLGLAVALVGFARLAPTGRHLARDQAFLSDQGCRRLLVRALTTPPTQAPGSSPENAP